jgi:hypothetical protein
MKMNKIRMRHDTNLASYGSNTKKQSLQQLNRAHVVLFLFGPFFPSGADTAEPPKHAIP